MTQKELIYDLLPEGAENAMSRRTLAAITGLSDRHIRDIIADLVADGRPVCSLQDGYFRATGHVHLYAYRHLIKSYIAKLNKKLQGIDIAIAQFGSDRMGDA